MIGKHTEKPTVDFSGREAEVLAENCLRVEANAQNTLNLWIQRAILRKRVAQVGIGVGFGISFLSIIFNHDDFWLGFGGYVGGIFCVGGLCKRYADKQERIIKELEAKK